MVLNKKEIFLSKNANDTISIYENCMNSIFFMATTEMFPSNFEIAIKFVWIFFQPQKNFVLNRAILKKNVACKI